MSMASSDFHNHRPLFTVIGTDTLIESFLLWFLSFRPSMLSVAYQIQSMRLHDAYRPLWIAIAMILFLVMVSVRSFTEMLSGSMQCMETQQSFASSGGSMVLRSCLLPHRLGWWPLVGCRSGFGGSWLSDILSHHSLLLLYYNPHHFSTLMFLFSHYLF